MERGPQTCRLSRHSPDLPLPIQSPISMPPLALSNSLSFHFTLSPSQSTHLHNKLSRSVFARPQNHLPISQNGSSSHATTFRPPSLLPRRDHGTISNFSAWNCSSWPQRLIRQEGPRPWPLHCRGTRVTHQQGPDQSSQTSC